ncbi:MAG: hypothetical protein IJ940_07965 [Bacteroidales bacterium]|nr:hypothetical protein [Bacteroidales bacterium]
MKKLYTILLTAALCASCEEFQPVFTLKPEAPEYQKPVEMEVNTTIAALKDMYVANGNKPITIEDDIIVGGQVTTSDKDGNLYKSFYIQDETAGIEVKVGKNGLYNEYKLGQWVYVKCEGLTVGDYNGMIQIGYSDPSGEYETSYIEHSAIINTHVFKGPYAEPVEPVVITEAELHDKVNLGRLVTIRDLKYDDHVFILAYVDPNGDRKDYTNNGIFIDEEGPDNYGVTTWACSEQKWVEYLENGNFDSVEVGSGTVADYRQEDGSYAIGSMAYAVSQYFRMGKTDVQVRTSGYARFSDTEIPQEVLDGTATVTLTGILTEYKGASQFTLIDLDGVITADGKPWYK